ncbi:MAG: ABC transporter permease [Pseudomonadota bacterium]
MFTSTLLMALREIRRNLMRSGLTALGIVIGVASVIAMVTLGEGATADVTASIGAMGDNLLIVSPGAERHGPIGTTASPFTNADERALRAEITGVSGLAPSVSRGVLAVYGNKNWNTTITGSSNDFFKVRGYSMSSGRRFSETELLGGGATCVLGATVVQELFGQQDPLGASVRVGNVACQVIGVLGAKGQSSFGMDQDDLVVMPLSTVQRRLAGSTDIGSFFLSAASSAGTTRVKTDVELLLRQRRHIQPGDKDDFNVRDMKEIAQTMSTVTGVLTALLGAIAAVSLLVGGIGIMNIMLVSVTERTREIGIRLAIGARGREVLLQFLVEAVVLSVMGGAAGVAIGLAGSYAALHALHMPFKFLPNIVGLAFAFSAAVGIVFGYVPARKAARLNPIEALRYE